MSGSERAMEPAIHRGNFKRFYLCGDLLVHIESFAGSTDFRIVSSTFHVTRRRLFGVRSVEFVAAEALRGPLSPSINKAFGFTLFNAFFSRHEVALPFEVSQCARCYRIKVATERLKLRIR